MSTFEQNTKDDTRIIPSKKRQILTVHGEGKGGCFSYGTVEEMLERTNTLIAVVKLIFCRRL